jgi:hypothetical protein
MVSSENPDDRGSIPQLNTDLQQAQTELLNAHHATRQLGLRYSADNLALFGRRDLLRKSAEAASALNQFYATIERKIPTLESTPVPPQPSPEQIAMAVNWVATYLQEQRDHYVSTATPLAPPLKALMWPYFSSAFLDGIRMMELFGERVAPPAFFSQARALGFEPPEVSHMDSLTFLDVVVFNERLSARALFHALVHSVQIQVLGLERYAEMWVGSFIRTRMHFMVPLEVHAFSLASKFLLPAPERFSVEDSVRAWVRDNRY